MIDRIYKAIKLVFAAFYVPAAIIYCSLLLTLCQTHPADGLMLTVFTGIPVYVFTFYLLRDVIIDIASS